MTKQDEADLARFRERERGELIDNLYRARLITSLSPTLTTATLKEMWYEYGQKMQRQAWGDGYDDFRKKGAGQRD